MLLVSGCAQIATQNATEHLRPSLPGTSARRGWDRDARGRQPANLITKAPIELPVAPKGMPVTPAQGNDLEAALPIVLAAAKDSENGEPASDDRIRDSPPDPEGPDVDDAEGTDEVATPTTQSTNDTSNDEESERRGLTTYDDDGNEVALDEPQDEAGFLKVIGSDADGNPVPPTPSPPPPARRSTAPAAPPKPARTPSGNQPEMGDDPSKMHLDDVDVRKALEILSRRRDLNLVVSPNVSGSVTADLSNLTADQMFQAILNSCNLRARHENGVTYVFAPDEYAQNGSGAPDDKIGIRVYRLNYVRSTDLEKLLKPFLSKVGKMTSTPPSQVGVRPINPVAFQGSGGGGGGGGNSGGGGGGSGSGGGNNQAPSGGNALADQEAIVVEDRESVLAKLDRVIEELDVQPLQVLIEAVILNVSHTNACELGVNWGFVNSAGDVLGVLGDGAALNAAAGFSPVNLVTNGLVKGTATSGFGIDDQALKFGFASHNVQSFIRAAEQIGKVDVLASPRLLVLNKQLAELQLGERLGYSTISQSIVSTAQQIQFMNVGTLLRVRPFISSDGMVRLEVHPERSRGSIVDNVPQASTSEVTTNVIVPDGSTLVIGGLMDQEITFEQNGIAGLDRIPVIGALFRLRRQSTVKKELLVLLTTHIWRPEGPLPNSMCPPEHCPPDTILPGETLSPQAKRESKKWWR